MLISESRSTSALNGTLCIYRGGVCLVKEVPNESKTLYRVDAHSEAPDLAPSPLSRSPRPRRFRARPRTSPPRNTLSAARSYSQDDEFTDPLWRRSLGTTTRTGRRLDDRARQFYHVACEHENCRSHMRMTGVPCALPASLSATSGVNSVCARFHGDSTTSE